MSEGRIFVDPSRLIVPSSRPQGADPSKLWEQVHRYGDDLKGMPPIEVWAYDEHEFVIADGLTRATRAAMFAPSEAIEAIVVRRFDRPAPNRPRLGELI